MKSKLKDVSRLLVTTSLLGGMSLPSHAFLFGKPAAPPTPAPTYAHWSHRIPCVDRIGRCFEAEVGGHPVTAIEDKAEFERLKVELRRLNRNVREVYWVIRQPIDGNKALDVAVRTNEMGKPHVGEPAEEPDVTVYALDGQDLESVTEQVVNRGVLVNGQPVVTQQETLTEDWLPPGRYVFAIKYIGEENWDRKWVFLRVLDTPRPAHAPPSVAPTAPAAPVPAR